VSDPWNEVMKLAEKYGFIFYAHGGVTLLLSHEEQKKQDVFEALAKIDELRDEIAEGLLREIEEEKS